MYAGMEHKPGPKNAFASDRSAVLNGLAATLGFVPGLGDLAGLAADANMYATDPGSRNWLNYGLSAAALLPGVPSMTRSFIARPKGWNASSDDVRALTRRGHLYRGMTKAEYDATVGAGKGAESTGAYSHSSEGTNFAETFEDAESYANYGRSDPRATGEPTYVVEIVGDGLSPSRDGYYKVPRVGADKITRVWEMFPEDGAVLGRLLNGD
jgi:hypothetical protein